MKLVFVALLLFSQVAFAKKILVYCSEASPKIFNPQLATDGATFNASSKPLYNRLVEFEEGGTKIIPGLATSWKISKNGLSYKFKLRHRVKFHTTKYFKPTRDFDADDVVFSFERMLDKNHAYHKVNGGTYEYFAGMNMAKLVKSVKKVSGDEVEFTLTQPSAPFLANMAMDFASILSKEYADELMKNGKPELLDVEPIGTGPFVFKRYVKDNLIRYTKNKKYFKGPAKLDGLVFSITPDPNVRFQKLKAGECQFIAEPSPTDIAALENMKNMRVLRKPGLNVGYLAFNTTKPPFNKVRVRKAISYALNKKQYIQAIYLNNATIAVTPIPPSMWSYNKSIKDYEYNPEKAKKLLKQAGFPHGFETDLWTLPVSRPYNPNGKKMGEMMQADLAKVGIKVKLVTYKWAEYLKRGSEGRHSMIQLGWTGDNGDPDNFLFQLLGCAAVKAGSNYARWCNKSFQSLVEKAQKISNVKARTKLYMKAQKIFKQQAPWVTIAHATVFKAMSRRVIGYKPSPFGTESFYEVDLR